MTDKLFRTAFTILTVITLLAAPASATTVKKMDLQELVSVSDAIAQGTVESIETRWEDKTIYTYTSLRVDESIKGGPRRAYLLRHHGGTIGALTLDAPGTPKFNPGDQVIVFLRDRKDGTYDVVGLGQGKYDIVDNLAVTNVSGLTLVDPATGRYLEGGQVDRKPLQAFKTQIRGFMR
jgi:hypothetical protein